MTDIAIRVDNLSKLYHLGAIHQRPDTLRDALTGFLPRIARISRNQKGNSPNSRQASQGNSPNSPNSRQASQGNSPNSPNSPNSRQASASDDLWALKDVSFEVQRGEVVGIIGRNGAGKSTLLKILSRITEPTSGRAEIHGRVGSLLEVGTGFHPELTGRENIYLNGAILGMHRVEIQRRFDEIVAFAEIERFLDTPVKRYSSGMYVRLAFAVAAHLEPEILLVDEVLAVGDAAFQRKCLGKMGDVAKEGRTVLFVSHNMGAIEYLCRRGLVLRDGELWLEDSAAAAVSLYLSQFRGRQQQRSATLAFRNPAPDSNLKFEVMSVEILNREGQVKPDLRTGDYARFRISWRAAEDVAKGGVELGIHTLEGVPLIQYSTRPISNVDVPFRVGMNYIDCEFPEFPLAAGEYMLSVDLTRPMVEWLYRNAEFAAFEVQSQDVFGTGVPMTAARGVLVVPHEWLDATPDREIGSALSSVS